MGGNTAWSSPNPHPIRKGPVRSYRSINVKRRSRHHRGLRESIYRPGSASAAFCLQPSARGGDTVARFIVGTPGPVADGARIAAILRPTADPGQAHLLLLDSHHLRIASLFGIAGAIEMAGNGYAGMTAYTRGKEWSGGPVDALRERRCGRCFGDRLACRSTLERRTCRNVLRKLRCFSPVGRAKAPSACLKSNRNSRQQCARYRHTNAGERLPELHLSLALYTTDTSALMTSIMATSRSLVVAQSQRVVPQRAAVS